MDSEAVASLANSITQFTGSASGKVHVPWADMAPNSVEKKAPNNLETHTDWNNVTLRIIWHNFLRSIWHSGEPSEQRDSDLASFQDGA
jgi:hypothetical protein